MKYLFLIVILGLTDPIEISKINGLKRDANEAYQSGNYQAAAATYSMLADTLGINEDEILLNLAHSHFKLGDTANAKIKYQSLSTSSNKKLKSVAYQQLGVLAKDSQKLEEALRNLKSALKADPTNAGAKYDYEVVKKMLDQQKENQEENQDQNQENQDQENKEDQEQKDQEKQEGENQEKQNQENQEKSQEEQEGEQSEEKGEEKEGEEEGENKKEEQEGEQSKEEKEGEPTEEEKQKQMEEATKQKLKEMNISPEKARMILEALKNNEVQFIQQQKRQPTKKKDTGKPDW